MKDGNHPSFYQRLLRKQGINRDVSIFGEYARVRKKFASPGYGSKGSDVSKI